MASSAAQTADEYLAELPPPRAAVVAHVRDLVNAAVPDGYQEAMHNGMIMWAVPLEAYPDTYNRQPLAYVGLAAQKNHYALYLMGVYAQPQQEAALRRRWLERGARLDMGRSCLRFRKLEDLQEDLVVEAIGALPVADYVALAKRARTQPRNADTVVKP